VPPRGEKKKSCCVPGRTKEKVRYLGEVVISTRALGGDSRGIVSRVRGGGKKLCKKAASFVVTKTNKLGEGGAY